MSAFLAYKCFSIIVWGRKGGKGGKKGQRRRDGETGMRREEGREEVSRCEKETFISSQCNWTLAPGLCWPNSHWGGWKQAALLEPAQDMDKEHL